MHKMVRIDAKGTQGAAYANRMWVDGHLESFAAYERRVTNDLDLGHAPPAQGARADPRRPVRLSVLRGRQLADERPAHPGLPGPGPARALLARCSTTATRGSPPRTAQRTLTRKEVNTVTTAAALYAWLAIDPRTPAQVKAQAAAHAALVARAAPSPKAAPRHHAKARRTTSHTKARHTKARRAAIHRRRTKHSR